MSECLLDILPSELLSLIKDAEKHLNDYLISIPIDEEMVWLTKSFREISLVMERESPDQGIESMCHKGDLIMRYINRTNKGKLICSKDLVGKNKPLLVRLRSNFNGTHSHGYSTRSSNCIFKPAILATRTMSEIIERRLSILGLEGTKLATIQFFRKMISNLSHNIYYVGMYLQICLLCEGVNYFGRYSLDQNLREQQHIEKRINAW